MTAEGVVAACRDLGYLCSSYDWSRGELFDLGWTREIQQTVEVLRQRMTVAVVGMESRAELVAGSDVGSGCFRVGGR